MSGKVYLRQTRDELGMTQEQLAECLDVTPEYISMIENGRKPLSKKLRVKLAKLVGGKLPQTETYPTPKDESVPVRDAAPSLERRVMDMGKRISEMERAIIRLSNQNERTLL